MTIFLIVFFILFTFILVQAFRYRNPYKLIMVFGKKGSGKTTLMCKLAWQYCNRGKQVYCNVPMEFKHDNLHLFDVRALGLKVFPPGSVVFIDEVGMIWDNRDYKNFSTSVRDYFKLQRQLKNTVYLFSQTFDVDVKIRNLCDSMYLCSCKFNFLSYARRVSRIITITNPIGDAESRITERMEFEPLIFSLFGSGGVKFTYIPRWVKKFRTDYMASTKEYRFFE